MSVSSPVGMVSVYPVPVVRLPKANVTKEPFTTGVARLVVLIDGAVPSPHFKLSLA